MANGYQSNTLPLTVVRLSGAEDGASWRKIRASDEFMAREATDPVCGMKVDDETATIKADYNGATYYFCSEECKERFQLYPEVYAQKAG
jgi:YHS domain-containing protein